ncbi:MAG: serine hydrolase domain-containing protein [Bacteroidota bacterium]
MKLEIIEIAYRLALIVVLFIFGSGCGQKSTTDKSLEVKRFHWKYAGHQNDKIREGIDSLVFNIEKGVYGFIDEVFIAKNDTIFFHEKFNLDYDTISKDKVGKMGCGSNMCKDSGDIHIYNYYHPKFHPYHLNSDLHTLQSITKSVTSSIVGTAINSGHISSVNEIILPHFSDFELSDTVKKHLESVTLQHVLTMQLGLKWQEFGLSLEMENNVTEMELSEDWITYALNQPIESTPGTAWNYNSGASQMLSQIIKSASGKTIDKFAEEHLFKTLDIDEYFWKKTPTGLPDTEGGLYLKAEDLAKIGLLYLQDGLWDDEQLLPKNFCKDALQKHVVDIYGDGGKEGYGYQWWLTGDEPPMPVGLGYGNQILLIIPDQKIIAIVLAWNVFDNDGKYIFSDLVESANTLTQ